MDSHGGRGPRRWRLAAYAGPGRRTRFWRRASALLGALLALALAPAAAPAADTLTVDPAIERGVAQLEGVQLPDGGFGGRLTVRNTATAGEALRAARSGSPAIAPIATYLAARELTDVDSLSRAALAAPSSAYASALRAEQNADGGFGLSNEYQSDILDTALALRALTALDQRDAAKRAAERLLKFSSAGVWGADGGEASLTAEALQALDSYIRRYGSTTAIDATMVAALAWLGDAQQADGSWVPGALAVRNTALAVSALAHSPSEIARVSSGADSLLAAQQPDGSWGDPFSTGLALRALHGAREAIERDRVTQLADPSVHARDISASPQTLETGKPITIKATVNNGGQAAASGVTAELFLDDPASGAAPVATTDVPELAAGSGAPVEATFSVTKPPGRLRAYVVLRAPVGKDRNLANNTSFINIFVKASRKTYARVRDWPRPGRDIQRSGATPNVLHAGIDPDPVWRVPAASTYGGHIVAEGKVVYAHDARMKAVNAKTGATAWLGNDVYTDDRYRAPVYNNGWLLSSEPGGAGIVNMDNEYPSYGIGGWGGDVPMFTHEVIPIEGNYDAVLMYNAQLGFVNINGRCGFDPTPDPSGSPWNHRLNWEGTPTQNGDFSNYMTFGEVCDGNPLGFASDGTRAFFTNADFIGGFDAKTGRGPNGETATPLFTAKVPGMHRMPAPPLVDSLGQVVAAGWEGTPVAQNLRRPDRPLSPGTQTGKGKVVATNPATGQVYWSFTTDTRLDGTPVEYKGTIVAVDRSGKVYGLDQITGELEWSWKPTGYTPPAADQQGKSGQTLALSRHYLYVPHPDGHIYTLDARNGSELSSTMFTGRPYDLAIDDTNNQIYVRTLDGQLGAYPTRELPDQCLPDPAYTAPAAPGDITRASFNADRSQLTGTGARNEQPAFSRDGRFVAFAKDTGQFSTALQVRDLQGGETDFFPTVEQVDKDSMRISPRQPALSSDGRYLGFIARYWNTKLGIDGAVMFVKDRQTGTVEPVVKRPDGNAQFIALQGGDVRIGNAENPAIQMSDDGKTFAIATTAKLVPEDTDQSVDVYVLNRATQARKLISRTSTGQQVPHQSSSPSISRDGRYVAFTSEANLTGGPVATGQYDGRVYAYRYDLATDEIKPVSVNGAGQLAGAYSPNISADGRFVAFGSGSPTFLPAAQQVWPFWWGRSADGYLWDSTTGNVELVSVNEQGHHNNNADVRRPVVSDDGRYVVWQAPNVGVKNQTWWNDPQIIVRDRVAGTTRQVSHNRLNVSGRGGSYAPQLSADGTKIAFLSVAGDLVEGDTNNAYDVFVHDASRVSDDEPFGDVPGGGAGYCAGDVEDESYSDLSVEPADIQPTALEQGQPGQVEVTVRNGGGVDSEATTVRLYDGDPAGGRLIGEQSLAELAAGADAELSFTWDPVTGTGAHTLTVVLDPDRLVFEQNVANNDAATGAHVAAPQLDLTVGSDKPAYGANETVALDARIANGSVAGRDVRLVASIRDEDGEQVATVHDGQVRVDADGEASVDSEWGTQDTTPGRYTVSARLLNAVGDELTSAESEFTIEPDVDAGLAIETDQLSYGAGETARIAALVTNRSANSSLEGAHVKLSLDDADGEEIEAWDLPAGNVGQGRTARLDQERALDELDPGTYGLRAKLLAADGDELADAAGDFELRSSADTGDGVTGTLTASPADPYRFSTAAFRYSVANAGNADIEGATVRVRISDLTSGDTVKTLDEERAITRGAPNTGSLAARMDLPENRDYQASLHLVLADGSERALDRAIVHVRPVPFTYGASFDTSAANRVLVWACEPADQAAARDALGATFATYVAGCGTGGEDQQRFMRLMRSGDYNQFWILGEHHPIERGMGGELTARVIQGDGLLIANARSGHDLNYSGSLSPFGAAYAGTVPPGSYTLGFAPGSAFAGLDATVGGSPAKLTTTQATAIATTSWGSAGSRKTAISATYNQFGRGKAVYVGAAPSDFADRAKAAAVLDQSARVLLPAADVTRATGLARLKLFVEGVAPGSPLEMRTQLPAGMSAPQPPADATLAGNLLTLPFDAAGTQRKERAVWLKLPAAAGSATTRSTVHYDADGKQYGEPATATLDVAEDAGTVRHAALAALAAVGTSGAGDQAKLQKIKDDLGATAQATTDAAVLWTRLRALLDDIRTLESARWTGTASAWTAVARLVTYVEHDYYRAGGE
jgi:Tol biopolymer transport system component